MPTGIATFNVNLRAAPGLDQPVLMVLPRDTVVTILADQGEWLQVQAPDSSTGYAASRYIEMERAAVELPPSPRIIIHTPEPLPARLVTPSGEFVNLRETPMIAPDNLIARIEAGTLLTPLEDEASVARKVGTPQDQNLWLQVRTSENAEGYVAAWLIRFPTPESSESGDRAPHTDEPSVAALNRYIDSISDGQYPLPDGYVAFQSHRHMLGLPDPFDTLPIQPTTFNPAGLPVNGFGPNSFAFKNWKNYYNFVCGMHNGFDYIVPKGTPLLAVADGIIVGTQKHWPFLNSPFDSSLVLWPFLPGTDDQGRRLLSNVLVAYAHMSDNTSFVSRHDVVKAGQVIGLSGFPINTKNGQPDPETNDAHLHLEVHLIDGDANLPRSIRRPSGLLADFKGAQPFDNRTPFNPLLFFSPRLVKYHRHQGAKIGFGGGPTYPSPDMLAGIGLSAWPELDFFTLGSFQYGKSRGEAIIWDMATVPWSDGVFDLTILLERVPTYTPWTPCPLDFL